MNAPERPFLSLYGAGQQSIKVSETIPPVLRGMGMAKDIPYEERLVELDTRRTAADDYIERWWDD